MKMNNVLTVKNIATLMVAGVVGLASCSKNDDVLNAGDTQNVGSESISESSTNETAAMTNSIVSNTSDTQLGSARVADIDWGSVDGRLTGATITIAGTGGKSSPSGTITIDYGTTGITDTYGVTRKGVITINYSGRRMAVNSTRIIHYTGYSRTYQGNQIVFDNGMTFTLTNTSTDSTGTSFQFHHVLAGGLLTFTTDNTTIQREANFDVSIDFANGSLTLSADANADHSAHGQTRAKVNYTMDIVTPIVYKVACAINSYYLPASGEKSITVIRTYDINYGNGDCDNTITVSVGGKSATITVGADGN